MPDWTTSPEPSQFWWVNHKQTHRQELDGEYLWSPKRNQNGSKNQSYDNMPRVRPGDIVSALRRNGPRVSQNHAPPVPAAAACSVCCSPPEVV